MLPSVIAIAQGEVVLDVYLDPLMYRAVRHENVNGLEIIVYGNFYEHMRALRFPLLYK